VRLVAGGTAVHANCGVLIDKGSALIDVTFETGLFVAFHLIHHAWPRTHTPGGSEGPVRVVAIGAFDRAFIHAMLERHIKLRADGGVAGIAEVALVGDRLHARFLRGGEPGRQQELWRSGTVDRMAITADHVIECMLASANIGAGNSLAVATEAGVDDFLGLHQGKRVGNGLFSAVGLDVIGGWSMTTFTPGFRRSLGSRSDAFVMGVAIKRVVDRLVAGSANVAAYIVGCG